MGRLRSKSIVVPVDKEPREYNAFHDGKDEEAAPETLQLTSLSDEYAVILIQRRWRERQNFKFQRVVRSSFIKKAQSAPDIR